MSGNEKLQPAIGARMADARTLKGVIDSKMDRGSSLSIALSVATVGIGLDTRGDWTISIGLSIRSDHFHQISLDLETLGFFHATETEGTSYLLWTSLLTEPENPRIAAEQVLSRTMKILQAAPISTYIS